MSRPAGRALTLRQGSVLGEGCEWLREPVDGNFHFEVGLHKALAGRTLRAQP